MTKIRGVVERITYQNFENGYSVLRVAVKGYNELITVVGNLIDANVGSVLLIEGDWKVNKKYGNQFIAQKWEETIPATAFGIEKYLGSGLIKGIGPKYAKRIVDMFGINTISVIEKTPERLNEVEGIGKKRVEMIAKSWEQQKEIKNIMLFLQSYNVSTSFAIKIYKMYDNNSIKVVKSNPYKLADDIWGIGFKTADEIASRLGFEKDCFIRCSSGILYTLNKLASEGHVYAEREQIITKSTELLGIEQETVTDALEKILKTNDLILDENAIYLPPFYMAETGVARRLKLLNSSPARINTNLKINIPKLEEKIGIKYDDIQAQSSRIIMNAHRINEGKFPDLSNGRNTDFFYIEAEEPETASKTIVELVKNRLPKYCNVSPSDIQVLSPMQKGIVGATNLNIMLQEAINPNDKCIYRAGRSFRQNDKVMQIRNNYDKEVFNGDIGTVSEIDFENHNLIVTFDKRRIEYDMTELDELVQAYAITIHKSQGSEYPVVVMPVMMTHYIMLQRNLIYTGITRAKKVLVIVGTKKAVSYAVKHVTVTKRNTKLKERLKEYCITDRGNNETQK